ncbi:DUF5067 domain-containing protein [uncultured Adlercreutzia sp.]|uniref:DUF5067 domain-containing protein n=1 Tax=uncultured Adlercreutzia sp. TaxID=875803 RepID=UPI002676FBC0|nr:DUF5067 domain-containing protein [uncultured Adlercreutzia sp.]
MEKLPRSGMAVASLVLGIVGIATSVLPIVNNLSFVMAVLGIVFGIIGIVGVTRGKKSGKGLAIAGVVLSVITVVLVLVMQAAFSAALDQALEESGYDAGAAQAGQQADAQSGDAEPAAAQQAEAASDYAVTIDGCRVTEDYEGEPVAVVTYTFTNNSDEAQSFMVALHPQVFQNGVELSTAIGSDWDSEKYLSDVKPGSSATVEIGYELEDASDVTVEVTELISFDDTVLAEATFSVA